MLRIEEACDYSIYALVEYICCVESVIFTHVRLEPDICDEFPSFMMVERS